MIHTFNLDGYPIGVLLAVDASRDEMITVATETGCSVDTCLRRWHWTPEPTTRGLTAVLPCHRAIIWFRSGADHGTIAHEAFHALFGTLPQLGIRLCNATEEVYAYALDSLVMAITDRLKAA